MARNYHKIVVTAPRLVFDPGAILGLASKEQTLYADYVEEVRTPGGKSKSEWRVKHTVAISKGTVLWVDEKFLPAGSDGLYDKVFMAKTYQQLLAPIIPKVPVDGGTFTPAPAR